MLFTTVQVCRMAGCSYRQLDYWVRCGAIRPDAEARGSGSQRGFTARQVEIVGVMAQLAGLGVPVRMLGEVAGALAELPELEGLVLVRLDGTVASIESLDDLGDGWVVALSTAVDGVTACVA